MRLLQKTEEHFRKPAHPDKRRVVAAFQRLAETGTAVIDGTTLVARNTSEVMKTNKALYQLLAGKGLFGMLHVSPRGQKTQYICAEYVDGEIISEGKAAQILAKGETNVEGGSPQFSGVFFDDAYSEKKVIIVSVLIDKIIKLLTDIVDPIGQQLHPLMVISLAYDFLIRARIEQKIYIEHALALKNDDLSRFGPLLLSRQPHIYLFEVMRAFPDERKPVKDELGVESAFEFLGNLAYKPQILSLAERRVRAALRDIGCTTLEELITPEERQGIDRLVYGEAIISHPKTP